MNESNNLSLLALIIAVIALIISGWQLAQQLFATATDGKRFCQGSVMGIWARKTRLSWRWSQIRFETKYTTPEIRMTSGVREEAIISSIGRRAARKPRLIYRTPILGWLAEVFNGPSDDWTWFFEITSDRADLPLEVRRTARPKTDILPNSNAESLSWWITKRWDIIDNDDSPDIVSWPIFLKNIYRNQISSITKVEPVDTKEDEEISHINQVENGKEDDDDKSPHTEMSGMEREQGEDRVMLRLVERSWDLIPPDVVRLVLLENFLVDLPYLSPLRPLAKSTVGTMIVVAQRLGMGWQGEFNPSEGKMNAAGNGHTISSETIRGLGTVLQYTFHAESKSVKNSSGSRRGLSVKEYLSPTTVADKLHCGCLPIDRDVRSPANSVEDIHLIDVTRMLDLDAFLTRLGVPSKESKVLLDKTYHNSFGSPDRSYKHSLEEAISILCPIPTLPDSEARWIVWPFRSARQPYTPFRQIEGLEELRRQLSKYLREHKPGTDIMENRQESLKHLSRTPLECLDILLAAYEPLQQHRRRPNADAAQKFENSNIYRQIRDIHKETSAVFRNVPDPQQSEEDKDTARSFLFNMAAAQLSLGVKYGGTDEGTADHFAMTEGAKDNLSEGETRTRFVQKLAQQYVEDMHDKENRAVRKHLRRRGYVGENVEKLKNGEVPALWWVAVVRSACWWMSVRIRLPDVQIPSTWYDSQQPVYIT